MIKILLAFDSFKGCLSAEAACRQAAIALAEAIPAAVLVEKPMADGGEGTAASLLAARGGEWIPCPATGPLPGMTVDAGFGLLPDGETAVVEMAASSGLTLLRPDQRNPLATTSLGTGELISAALSHGARRILLAVGGSASVDGGIGAAHALGWRFLDGRGHELPPLGGALHRIAAMRAPAQAAPTPESVVALADVTNPLCGPNGAARVYGPQKGATPEAVAQLDAGLAHFAALLQRVRGADVLLLPGGGAGGGLAAGAAALFGARIHSGIDMVMDAVGLDEALSGADWVVTGEGSFDAQSLQGKVVSGVIARARRDGVRVAVLAGRVALDAAQTRAAGIAYAEGISPPGLPIEEAIRQAPHFLRQAATRFAEECA